MNVRSHFLSALAGGLLAALAAAWMLRPVPVSPFAYTKGSAPRLYWSEPVDPSRPLPELPTAAIDFRPAARLATPAVVHVDARVDGRDRATVKALFDREDNSGSLGGEGSGVIYRPDGYIITNYHVVQAADRITVTTSDRRRFPATIVGT